MSPSRRRRLALLVVAVGVALAAAPWLDHGRGERVVELEIDDPATLAALEVSWLEDGDVLRRTIWRYPARDAPRQLQQTLQLRDGSYEVILVVDRGGGARTVERRIDVSEDVSKVTVPVP